MGVVTLEAKSRFNSYLTYSKKHRWLGNSVALWVAARLVRMEKRAIYKCLGRWLGLGHYHAQPKGKSNRPFQQGWEPRVKAAHGPGH